MKDFFASIYEVFISFYGDNLAGYLYGFCDDGDGGLYSQIGLSMLIITIVLSVFYYFIFVNAERYKLKYWMIFFILSGLLSGLVSFYLPFKDIDSGLVCPQYIFEIESVIFFSIVNLIISLILFLFLSYLLKFVGKPQARYTPF